MEPILRWAGSKRRLMPVLAEATPKSFARYIEPFVGSGIYCMRLNTSEGVLSDINSDLMDTYRAVIRCPHAVWQRVADMPTNDAFYYEIRAQDHRSLPHLDRAARFVYLNRFCFNGVYRTNLEGRFNVARGKGHLFVPSLEVFQAFSSKIKSMDLLNEDFEAVIDQARAGDFLYLDPPYALEGQRDRGQYGIGTFKEQDETRLFKAILRAHRRRVKVLLSYTPRTIVADALPDWFVTPITVDRKVASKSADRRDAREIIVSNFHWESKILQQPGRSWSGHVGDHRRSAFRNPVEEAGRQSLDLQLA